MIYIVKFIAKKKIERQIINIESVCANFKCGYILPATRGYSNYRLYHSLPVVVLLLLIFGVDQSVTALEFSKCDHKIFRMQTSTVKQIIEITSLPPQLNLKEIFF